jgi:acetyltransferase-like isoleucine patch superfamily enzyme
MSTPPAGMPPFTQDWLDRYRQKGVDARAGRYSYGCPEVQFRPVENGRTQLRIGAFASIGRGCVINLGSFGRHTVDFVSTYPLAMVLGQPPRRDRSAVEDGKMSVEIGADVWLGESSLVFAGVTIGHGAVVGARSIVTRDVPPYAIVAGSPARLVRARFAPEIAERLLRLAWWDWPDEKIRDNLEAFFRRDVASSLEALEAAAAS